MSGLNPDVLTEISERLARATAADPLIDALIKLAFRPPENAPRYADIASLELREDCVRFYMKQEKDGKAFYGDWALTRIEPVTGSLDAATALFTALFPHLRWSVTLAPATVVETKATDTRQFCEWGRASTAPLSLASVIVSVADQLAKKSPAAR